MALAIDSLEENLVQQLDSFRTTSLTDPTEDTTTILRTQLNSILELLTLTTITNSKKLFSEQQISSSATQRSITHILDEHHNRLHESITYSALVEVCQNDTVPARRLVALSFFADLFTAMQGKSGYLNPSPNDHIVTTIGKISKGMYLVRRRNFEISLLLPWIEGCTLCITSHDAISSPEGKTLAAKATLNACSLLKLSLKAIAANIDAADDESATRIIIPLMKLVNTIVDQLLGVSSDSADSAQDSLRASSIKFLETLVLCLSMKKVSTSRVTTLDDFSLNSIPTGHPTITREKLGKISEDAFGCLRDWVEGGGQVKIVDGIDEEENTFVFKVKPAHLSCLASTGTEDTAKEYKWYLGQKSYTIAVNAVAIIGTSRITHFNAASVSLSKRAMSKTFPPPLSKSASMSITSAVRASCLKLLRNAFSVETKSADTLKEALVDVGMKTQSDKAFSAAEKLYKLQSAGRAERNRANLFYEWEAADSQRQKDTETAIEKVRAVKAARGLGNGIQLPSSITVAADLILANLDNLAQTSDKTAPDPARTLDWLVDAINSGGESLAQDMSRWYERSGKGWTLDKDAETGEISFTFDSRAQSEGEEIFKEQSQKAASDAFSRLVNSGRPSNNNFQQFNMNTVKPGVDITAANSASTGAMGMTFGGLWGDGMENMRDSLSAKLAWMLKGVQPRGELEIALKVAKGADQITQSLVAKKTSSDSKSENKMEEDEEEDKDKDTSAEQLNNDYPLASACLAFEVLSVGGGKSYKNKAKLCAGKLSSRLLYEAYVDDLLNNKENSEGFSKFGSALDILTSSVTKFANLTTTDETSKRVFSTSATQLLTNQMSTVPKATTTAIANLCKICDIEEVQKKTKAEKLSISERAAANAAFHAAEKRAKLALVAIRDLCFRRTNRQLMQTCVESVVGMACGRLPSSDGIMDVSLKIAMGQLYSKSDDLAEFIVLAATKELNSVCNYAVQHNDEIKIENEKVLNGMEDGEDEFRNENDPLSDLEKVVYERCRRTSFLYIALCLQLPDQVSELFQIGSIEKADTLFKAVKIGVATKLAANVGKKFGEAKIALQVANSAPEKATPLVLALLEHLVPVDMSKLPPTSFIDACKEIQGKRGADDMRYIIPILSSLNRDELIEKLPAFVKAGKLVQMAASNRMRERLPKHAATYRKVESSVGGVLTGMSLCEQFVEIHYVDFAAHGLTQNDYLESIKNFFSDTHMFNDYVVQNALQVMVENYTIEGEGRRDLPLAFMRTVMLTIKDHKSLLSYICDSLLIKLIKAKVWERQPKQWQGVMKCLVILREVQGSTSINSIKAILSLPTTQFESVLRSNDLVKTHLQGLIREGTLTGVESGKAAILARR